MTLLVHFLQYQLHRSEITNKDNGRQRPIPIIGASLTYTSCTFYR